MELRPTARSLQIVSSSAYSIKSLRTWKDKHAGAVDDIDQAVQQLERLQLSSQFVAGLEQDAANSSVISQRLRLALKESLGRCGTVLQDLDAQLSGAKDKHGSINLQKGRYVCSVDSLLEHLNNLKKETRRLDLLLDAYQRPNDEEKLRLLERLEERKNIFSFQTEHEPPTSARSTEVGITTRHKSRRLSFGKRNLSSTSSHCSLLGEQLGEQLGEGHNGNGNRAEARKALSNLASALKPRRSRAESAPLPFDSGMRQYTQKAQGSQTPAMGTVSSRSIMSEGGYEMIRGSTIAVCPSTLYKFGKPSVASSFDDEVPFLENNTTFSRPEAEYARSSMSRMCASLELPLYAPRGMQYYIPPLPIEYIPTPLRSATTSPQLSSPMSFQRPFTFPTYHRGSNSPTTLNRSDSQISHAYTQPTTSMEADIRLAVESPAAYSIDCPPSYYATTNDGPRGLPITTSSDTKITPHQFCPDAYCIESHRYTPCTSTPRYAYPPKPSINRPGCGWLHGPSATLDEANEEDEEYLYLADVRTYAQTPAIMIPKPTWLQLL